MLCVPLNGAKKNPPGLTFYIVPADLSRHDSKSKKSQKGNAKLDKKIDAKTQSLEKEHTKLRNDIAKKEEQMRAEMKEIRWKPG